MSKLNEAINSMLSGSVEGQIQFEGGTNVIPNPTGTATDDLEKIQIGDVIYNVAGGSEVIPNPTGTPTDNLQTIEIDDIIYTISTEQVQADWAQTDTSAVDYIKNKPTIPPAPVVMVGATSEQDGSSGYVPQPLTTDEDKFLKGDGTWSSVGGGNSYNKMLDVAFSTNMNGAYMNVNNTYMQYLRATSGYEGLCYVIDYNFTIGNVYRLSFDYTNTQTSFNNNYAWQASITNFTNGFDIGAGSKNLPQTATTQTITLEFTADATTKYLTFYMSAASGNCNNTFTNLNIEDVTP